MKPPVMKPVVIGFLTVLLFSGISLVGAAQQPPMGTEINVSPGERLSGVVGVQNAEVTGVLEDRTFGIKVAQAGSDETRADVTKTKLEELEGRLRSLHDRKRALERARANGTISNGTYHARIAVLAAETGNVNQQLNATETAAKALPAEIRASKGIEVEKFQMLKGNASNLTGLEVAEIARSIAGPNVGRSIAHDPSRVQIGPPDDVGPAANQTSTDVNRTGRGPSNDTSGPASPDVDKQGGGSNKPDTNDNQHRRNTNSGNSSS